MPSSGYFLSLGSYRPVIKERSLYLTPLLIEVSAANLRVSFELLVYSDTECFLKSEVWESLPNLKV